MTAATATYTDRLFAAVQTLTADGDWTVVEEGRDTFRLLSPEGRSWGTHATRELAARHAGIAARVRASVLDSLSRGSSMGDLARGVIVASWGESALIQAGDDEDAAEIACAVLRIAPATA